LILAILVEPASTASMNYVSEETIYDYTLSNNPQEKWRVELGADLFTNNG